MATRTHAATAATRADPAAPLFDLHGKIAFVTGGGRGIGRGASVALGRQGADVAIGCVGNLDSARDTASFLEKIHRRSIVVEGDVSDAKAVTRMVDDVTRRLGEIDILVNNAGILTFEPFLDLREPTWDRVIDVNLKGQFLVAQAVARRMAARGKGGRIVNVASIGSGGVGVGFPSIAHYTASKGGVIAMTETMALELAKHKITVNAVAPGVIATDMTTGMLAEGPRSGVLARVPLGRAGQPEEIGAMVAFLASDEAAYCTGGTFYVDGGWLAG